MKTGLAMWLIFLGTVAAMLAITNVFVIGYDLGRDNPRILLLVAQAILAAVVLFVVAVAPKED